MNPQVIKGVEIADNIELAVKVDDGDHYPSDQNEIKALQMEQYQKYLQVLKDLDLCEKRVGPWEPSNNFHNIYNMIDSLQEQIESIN